MVPNSGGFSVIGEHTSFGHDCNLVVPFGGKPPGSEGPNHNRLPAVPFGGKTAEKVRSEGLWRLRLGKEVKASGSDREWRGKQRSDGAGVNVGFRERAGCEIGKRKLACVEEERVAGSCVGFGCVRKKRRWKGLSVEEGQRDSAWWSQAELSHVGSEEEARVGDFSSVFVSGTKKSLWLYFLLILTRAGGEASGKSCTRDQTARKFDAVCTGNGQWQRLYWTIWIVLYAYEGYCIHYFELYQQNKMHHQYSEKEQVSFGSHCYLQLLVDDSQFASQSQLLFVSLSEYPLLIKSSMHEYISILCYYHKGLNSISQHNLDDLKLDAMTSEF
ncbi:hypothetical protein M5K25_003251 [Dendrobium thyrsiflorum]|uniref:Uncharacterized protein n=1 Tax=Dendrobium thyrsiflorum TaxID=117978 RepID=A0ABD0VXP5_DENTH